MIDCKHLNDLLKSAKFDSLFRALAEIDFTSESELSGQYIGLSARFNRYRNEKHLMSPSEFELAQNRLTQGMIYFLDDLCKSSLLETPVRKEKGVDSSKSELLALIDENRYSEVFEKIKNGAYQYERAMFSRLERQFAFQVTLDLVDQLKVFVGSLRS